MNQMYPTRLVGSQKNYWCFHSKIFLAFLLLLNLLACGQKSKKKSPAEVLPAECSNTSCAAPKAQSFSFHEQLLVFDANCQVKSAEIYDVSTHLQVFFHGDCGNGVQLYTATLGYDSTSLSEFQLLSYKCSKGAGQVKIASIGQSQNGFLFVNECQLGSKSESYIGMMSPNGDYSSESILDSLTTQTSFKGFQGYSVAWNDLASAWGVLGNNKVRRFNAEGKQIGGSASLGSLGYNPSLILHVFNGDWIGKSRGNCFRMSGQGIVSCRKIGQTGYLGQSLLWDSVVIYHLDNERFVFTHLNMSNCEESEELSLKSLGTGQDSWPQSYSPEFQIYPVKINPLYTVLPFFVKNRNNSTPSSNVSEQGFTLNYALLKKSAVPQVVWVVPVADNVTLSPRSVVLANKKVYSVYLRGDLLYISTTTGEIL